MSTIKCFKEVQTLKDIEGKEMFTFSEVLKKVDLSESALRKYVALIDKQSPDGKYFYRNKKNHRLYSLTDITLLQQLVGLKSTGITLDNAINQALFSVGYSSVTVEDTEESVSGVTLQSIMSVVYKQVEIMEKQANNIERLETLVEKLLTAEEEKNNQLDIPADNKTKIEFVDPSEPAQVKKGFFSRLLHKKE